jgi:cytoskeletal protein RodZ
VRKAARDSEFGAMARTLWQPLLLGMMLLAMCAAGYLWWRAHSPLTRAVAAAPAPRSLSDARPPAVAAAKPRAISKAAEAATPGVTKAPPETATPPVKAAKPAPASASPSGQVGNDQATAETPGAVATPGQATSLIGLTPMYQIQDVGDSRLTPAEAEELRRQLHARPPEVAVLADKVAPADICRVCWSIVYRPLNRPENL